MHHRVLLASYRAREIVEIKFSDKCEYFLKASKDLIEIIFFSGLVSKSAGETSKTRTPTPSDVVPVPLRHLLST